MHNTAYLTHLMESISRISWITLFFILLQSASAARQLTQGQGFHVQPWKPQDYWVPSPNIISYSVLELEMAQVPSNSPGIVLALRRGFQIDGLYGTNSDVQLNSTNQGEHSRAAI